MVLLLDHTCLVESKMCLPPFTAASKAVQRRNTRSPQPNVLQLPLSPSYLTLESSATAPGALRTPLNPTSEVPVLHLHLSRLALTTMLLLLPLSKILENYVSLMR